MMLAACANQRMTREMSRGWTEIGDAFRRWRATPRCPCRRKCWTGWAPRCCRLCSCRRRPTGS